MTAKEILTQLQLLGSEAIRNVYKNHGAPVTHYGVKVEDMKKIQKKIKKDHKLSLQLFDSGIPDAQYLAGLVADEKKMTKKELQHWAETASWHMVGEYTVPWIAAESEHGWELAIDWINSDKETLQASGWATMASLAAIKEDRDLDIKELRILLKRVEIQIHQAPNRVRYVMNNFVISTGGYIKELTDEAVKTAKCIGTVEVDVGKTSCKVPSAQVYIQKMRDKGVIGKKKKMARC